MPDYSGALKKFRDSGYPKNGDDEGGDDQPSESSGVRTIKLTDDEVKELSSYQKGPGEEQVCEVSGKLEGNVLRVLSVRSPGGEGPDVNADAEEMMSQFRNGQPPMTQSQTLPSPS